LHTQSSDRRGLQQIAQACRKHSEQILLHCAAQPKTMRILRFLLRFHFTSLSLWPYLLHGTVQPKTIRILRFLMRFYFTSLSLWLISAARRRAAKDDEDLTILGAISFHFSESLAHLRCRAPRSQRR